MATEKDAQHLRTVTRAYREQRDELMSLRALQRTLSDLLVASREAPDESLLMGRLEKVLAVSCTALNAHSGAVLVCEHDNSLVFVSVHGEASQALMWERIGRTVGIAGWVVKNCKSAIVNNAAMDERFFSGVDSETGMRTQSLLASPILSRKGKPLGVLEVVNKQSGQLFSSNDLRTLDLVAHAIGLVLAGLTDSVDGLVTGRLAAAASQRVAS